MFFVVSLRQNSDIEPRLCHSRLLPNPFQFISYSIMRRYIVSILKALVNNLQKNLRTCTYTHDLPFCICFVSTLFKGCIKVTTQHLFAVSEAYSADKGHYWTSRCTMLGLVQSLFFSSFLFIFVLLCVFSFLSFSHHTDLYIRIIRIDIIIINNVIVMGSAITR
jgi:hypothetical protein